MLGTRHCYKYGEKQKDYLYWVDLDNMIPLKYVGYFVIKITNMFWNTKLVNLN